MDLPLRFILDGELYVLAERRDASPRDEGLKEVGPWEAQALLASALSQADPQALVRAGLGGPAREHDWDDVHALAARLRAQLGEGQLVLLRRRKPRHTLVLTKPEAVDLGELVELAASADAPEDGWIEVLVVDDDDQPVAGVEYEIELSDGRVQRGRTSEHGILRYEDLPEGSCKVRLLGVDARGWDVA